MNIINKFTPKNISSLIISHSARENLEQKPSLAPKAIIKDFYNLMRSVSMKNSYSPHRVEIKSKLNEHKIQAELKEIKNRAEEKEIENGLKKMNISLPITSGIPIRALGEAQPININSRTKKAEVVITYNTDRGLALTHEYYLSMHEIKMAQISELPQTPQIAKISQISQKDAMILLEVTELPVSKLYS